MTFVGVVPDSLTTGACSGNCQLCGGITGTDIQYNCSPKIRVDFRVYTNVSKYVCTNCGRVYGSGHDVGCKSDIDWNIIIKSRID